MSGLVLKLSLKDIGAGQVVKQLAENISRPQRFLQEVGMVMFSSIQQNFIAQGRPVPWEPSKRALDWHGKTLRKSGRLMNSITMKVYENSVKVGTNVIYAAIHHFGGTIDKTVQVKGYKRIYKKSDMKAKSGGKWFYPISEVKSHSREMNTTIPARPYMMLQPEDWETIKKIGYDYLIPIQGAPST